MLKYKVCLIFLLYFPQWLWGVDYFTWLNELICPQISSEAVVKSLKLQGFKCISKKVKGCSYDECLGTVSGYSKEVLVLVPSLVTRLRVHFRGHKNGPPSPNVRYDQDLKGTLEAFQLAGPICNMKEAVVMPDVSGRCDEYDRELIDRPTFDAFFQGIYTAVGSNSSQLPLHVSAHSGGGRTAARLLKSGIDPSLVTIFDGIYSEEQEASYREWLTKGRGKINLFSMAGGDPSIRGRKLALERVGALKLLYKRIKSVSYQEQEQENIHLVERQIFSDAAHYSIVGETWENAD